MYEEFSKKYPLLFRSTNEQEPINLFGIECGEGWKDILDLTFRLVYNRYKNSKKNLEFWEQTKSTVRNVDPQILIEAKKRLQKDEDELPVVAQIKEKFGTLRIYCDNVNDYAAGVFDMAESLSGMTCEKCGARGKQTGSSWIHTLCENCEKKT